MVTNKIKRGKTREPLGRNCQDYMSRDKRQARRAVNLITPMDSPLVWHQHSLVYRLTPWDSSLIILPSLFICLKDVTSLMKFGIYSFLFSNSFFFLFSFLYSSCWNRNYLLFYSSFYPMNLFFSLIFGKVKTVTARNCFYLL